MAEKSLPIAQILTLLAEAPRRITATTSTLTEAQLHAAPSSGEWSANEVLAHLRSCADMWGNGIMTILAEDRPTIRAVNPRTWIKQTDYLELEFRSSLRAYTKQRAGLLTVLEPLSEEDWSRWATITGAGKPLQRTVQSYAQWMATHERPHIKQIERIVNTVRL